MTIQLTGTDFYEQFQEAGQKAQRDPSDELDITYKFDVRFSHGQRRLISLRKGLLCGIDSHQLRGRLKVDYCERIQDWVTFIFILSGKGEDLYPLGSKEVLLPFNAGKYFVYGSGIDPQSFGDYSDVEPHYRVGFELDPSVLYSFSSSHGKLPRNLQHLVRPLHEEVYFRSGEVHPMMAAAIQQFLHCPYQGIIKRAYLESKVIELIALVLDQEGAIQQGGIKKDTLRPEQLERVHYAKEILLRDISNPPSLTELTQMVGLNAFTLEQHFRRVFGKTVFGELQACRLEVAKQLLAEQDISIATAAHRVGYASAASFTKAFKRRFGITPRSHQKRCR